jgi:hypothetical protein
MTIVTIGDGLYIPPFSAHKTHAVSAQGLAGAIASILYFLVAGCGSDQEKEGFRCSLGEKFVAQARHRQGLLDGMMQRFGVPKDVVETNLE